MNQQLWNKEGCLNREGRAPSTRKKNRAARTSCGLALAKGQPVKRLTFIRHLKQ